MSGFPIIFGSGLKSVFATAVAAYPLRIPRGSGYSGALIRVRRSSDNAEQNINALTTVDANGDRWLDRAALLAFVGAASGYITTWYDQSDKGNHAVQTVAANQPQIVLAGALIQLNGKPTVQFLGNQYLLTTLQLSALTTGNALSFNSVLQPAVNTTYTGVLNFRGGTSNNTGLIFYSGTAFGLDYINANLYQSNFNAAYSAGTNYVVTGLIANLAQSVVLNGVTTGTAALSLSNAGTGNATPMYIGQDSNGGRVYVGLMSEASVFGTSLAIPTRQALERSQGAAFGLTVA